MTTWAKRKLEDLITIKHGYAFLGEYFKDEGSHIVLTPGNFYDKGGFRRRVEKDKWYAGSIPPAFILKKDDLIVAMTEQGEGLLGSSALIPSSNLYLHNQRLGLVEPINDSEVDKKFLYYLFNLNTVRKKIRGSASGTKVRHTSPRRIYEISVNIPDIFTQKNISSVLSAYDDLIENNEKRISLLEEITQRLYEEWFIKFNFPGHEKLKRVESNTTFGLIPEGWKLKKLSEVCNYIGRGISPKYDDAADCIVLNQKCIRNKKLNFAQSRHQSKAFSKEKLVKYGDILINSTGVGTLGRVAQVYDSYPNCTVDSHITIVRPSDKINLDYLGFTLFTLEDYFVTMGTGATGQTELSRLTIQDTTILVPPLETQQAFSEMVSKLRHLNTSSSERNDSLRKIRDLLIPQLMMGKRLLKNL